MSDAPPPTDHVVDLVPDKFRVNLDETSELIGVSLPTLKKLLKSNEDFPVLKFGRNGVAYELDIRAVKNWLEKHESEKAEADAARRAELGALQEELFGRSIDGDAVLSLTPEQRAKVADAKFKENRLAEQQGRLVEANAVRQVAEYVLMTFRQELQGLPVRLSKRFGFDRKGREDIEVQCRDVLNKCAMKLEDPNVYPRRSSAA